MYEYKCNKCKKHYEHYLKLYHPCKCGGKLQEIFKKTEWPLREKFIIEEDVPTTFIPVRLYGSIWYYRRKPRKKIKILKKSFF